MKKNLFYALLILSTLLRCTKAPEDKPEIPKDTIKTFLDSTNMFAISGFTDKFTEDLLSDPISIESTVIMSSLLLQERPLSNMARFGAWGGVFESSAFAMQANKVAVRLWYCYNPHDKKYPEFFLALEHIDEGTYDKNDPEKLSNTQNYIVPESFTYDKVDFEEPTIQNFILDHRAITTTAAIQITQAQIKEYSDNYKSLMRIISPSATQSYCKFSVAIFKYDQAYKTFLTAQDLKWVRYYMGLARDPGHKPNYLRPILAGVDSQHKPIGRTGVTADEPFLQKSVPPPPHQ